MAPSKVPWASSYCYLSSAVTNESILCHNGLSMLLLLTQETFPHVLFLLRHEMTGSGCGTHSGDPDTNTQG